MLVYRKKKCNKHLILIRLGIILLALFYKKKYAHPILFFKFQNCFKPKKMNFNGNDLN